MFKTYKDLLMEHVVHALTNEHAGTLKQYTENLIRQNSDSEEAILNAYAQVQKELSGSLDIHS